MYKIIYKFSFLLGIVFLIAACEKERVFPEYHEIEHGAYPGQIGTFTGPDAPAFNYGDPDNACVGFTVEFYDDQNGATVENYTWTATHAPSGQSAVIASIDKSQFVIAANGRPSYTFNFCLNETLALLGLTLGTDVLLGQAIDYTATLTTSSGQVFDRTNTNAVTQGQPAFKALFQIKSNLICPSKLAGEFDVVTTGMGVWAGTPCNSTWTGKVKWVTETSGVYQVQSQINGVYLYDMSMGGYTACYSGVDEAGFPNGAGGTAGSLRIQENCGKLSFIGLSQWAEVYSFLSVSVNGNQLTISWENSYGETATSVLTRTDGKDWPTNLYF